MTDTAKSPGTDTALRVSWLPDEPATQPYLSGTGWRSSASGRTLDIRSPIDGRVASRVQACTADEAKEAVRAAAAAWQAWNARPVHERASVLHRVSALILERREALARMLTLEIAKTTADALSEVDRTAEMIAYFAEEGRRYLGQVVPGDSFPGTGRDKLSLVTREPYGVVLAISPFNYPLNLSASKIAPALITGNAVVFKPALQGASSAMMMAALFIEAGVPEGVLTAVTGEHSEIGDALTQAPEVGFISFTGSTGVGERIAKAARFRGLQLEMGGKDAAIVMNEAPIERAVSQLVKGCFTYSAQRCTAVKRVILLPGSADAFVKAFVPAVEALKVGDPRDEGVTIVPLVTDKAADYVWELLQDALAKGAQPLTTIKREGRLLSPVVLDNVTPEMRIAWEEPFGPVLPILRVSDVDAAIDLANRSQYGLQSCVFTCDLDEAFYVGRRLEVGTVNVNRYDSRGPDHFPFTGVKDSGLGVQGVHYSIEAMTRLKSMVINFKDGTW